MRQYTNICVKKNPTRSLERTHEIYFGREKKNKLFISYTTDDWCVRAMSPLFTLKKNWAKENCLHWKTPF